MKFEMKWIKVQNKMDQGSRFKVQGKKIQDLRFEIRNEMDQGSRIKGSKI